jgi:hypothetical protein
MKPVAKPLTAIPVGIVKRAAQVPQPFALLLFLDCVPYCEIAERDSRTFNLALAGWRRSTLPTLARSNVRYFLRGKDLAITEVKP